MGTGEGGFGTDGGWDSGCERRGELEGGGFGGVAVIGMTVTVLSSKMEGSSLSEEGMGRGCVVLSCLDGDDERDEESEGGSSWMSSRL